MVSNPKRQGPSNSSNGTGRMMPSTAVEFDWIAIAVSQDRFDLSSFVPDVPLDVSAVGNSVGILESIDGSEVGIVDGSDVGDFVAIFVGARVDSKVGFPVGTQDGDDVGNADGSLVGSEVGTFVGAFVGFFVGSLVGSKVG